MEVLIFRTKSKRVYWKKGEKVTKDLKRKNTHAVSLVWKKQRVKHWFWNEYTSLKCEETSSEWQMQSTNYDNHLFCHHICNNNNYG